jgi:hypothetical protein
MSAVLPFRTRSIIAHLLPVADKNFPPVIFSPNIAAALEDGLIGVSQTDLLSTM